MPFISQQHGWVMVDIGPTTSESTPYPKHGEAAARLVASGDCRFGIILCGTGQGIMMAANKIKGIRCGVCVDTFSARMIRQHNDANMLAIGVRVVGEGLALDVVDTFLTASFEALEGSVRQGPRNRHSQKSSTFAALERKASVFREFVRAFIAFNAGMTFAPGNCHQRVG